MDTNQAYKLDDTNIYATLERVAPNKTRCTFRHNGHEVTGTANVRIAAFMFEDFIQVINDARYEIEALDKAIADFPDWDAVVESADDNWSPID